MKSDSDEAFEKTADAGGTPASKVALAPGRTLGKYRLDRILGEGGMGVVWAAHDPDLERAVALKVLRYAQAAPQLRQRLLREARAMAKLKHPNVLTVYEVGTVDDRDYIAMELVEGTSLDRWLAASPPHEEVWSAILAAGRGLAAAHEAEVVHRDFKPHNVLRSREGRILVTDFGLARGLLGPDMERAGFTPAREVDDSAAIDAKPLLDPAITPFDKTIDGGVTPLRASDPVLDSPLTQTGALIGTPAYMAPEQYQGAAPDPRTDQFAFCVTVWQALTGDRPFKGASLEEMRKSVNAGAAHIAAKIPRAVRAVLDRGLDPQPEKRWRSLEALLDALERAGRAPARRRRIALALAALAAALIIIYVTSRSTTKVTDGCDNSDAEFAEAWSPAVRAELARSPKAQGPGFARIADAFDQFRTRWIASYDKACKGRASSSFRARIGCLEGMRDQLSALTYLLRDFADTRLYEAFDPWGILPNLLVCEGPSPTAPPPVPTDQPRRSQIFKLTARTFMLRGVPADQLDATIDQLVADATPLKWAPLVPTVLMAAGNEELRRHHYMRARARFKDAIDSLPKDERRDTGLEANCRLGRFEASLHELVKPEAHTPLGITDPAAKPVLHDQLATELSSVTSSVGSNPMLLGARASLAAQAYVELGQFNRYKHAYDDALHFAAEARKQFDALGDVRRAALVARMEAIIYFARGDERALDDALFTVRRAADALEAAHQPPLPGLDEIRSIVAFARRDYTEAHRIFDRGAPRDRSVDARTIKGRVVPAAPNAIVVAWRGELTGDPRRLYMRPDSFVGDIAAVEHDGTFAIHAEPGWAIIAEGGGARSTPQVVGSAEPELKLLPVATTSGTVRGKNLFDVQAFARYRAGTSHWVMNVPVDREGSFDLRGLPPGERTYGLTGRVGTGQRTVATGPRYLDLEWPYGQAIEVIVRAKQFDEGARAWVLDHRRAMIVKRAELEAIAATAGDVTISELSPIGADNTDAGREVYRAGDRHAVITGNASQDYTVCAAATASGPVACQVVQLKPTVEIEYTDGRYAAGVTPLLFEL